MERYNCIIVEDEPLAAEVLQDYISQVPFLELRHTCSDAIYAMEILQKEKIDVVFLDIHLPKLKGLDFIKTIKNPPQVIITSAYGEYALQGYELNVIDYLLKPIELARFLTAVNKLKPQNENAYDTSRGHANGMSLTSPDRPHLFFNVSKKKVKIYIDEIVYIESLKEYIRITAKDKTVLTKFQLSQMEEMLPKEKFIRVHRSFIVSREKIDAFTATEVELCGKQIPIGRSYKELVINLLGEGV
jgi:DNA-binding LytR/AlgR family response regulator